MGGIFVSYRRSDSQGEAGRLFDDLVKHFEEDKVFMDVAAIEAGRDFRKAIEEGVTKCGVLLVVIGLEWLDAKNERGARRLNDPSDFVRIETASALKRDIPVVPVLVRGAKMPSAEQLPEELKELAFRNCIELTHARWKSDIQLLIEALRRLLGHPSGSRARFSEATTSAPSGTRPQETAIPSTREDASSERFDPATLARISRELALRIGPIASIVVKRAALRCNSVDDLYGKVAEEIDSREEREKFLREGSVAPSLIVKTEAATAQANDSPGISGLPRPSVDRAASSQIGRPTTRVPSKYWILAVGVSIFLILLLIRVTHFASSRGPASSQATQTSAQGTQVAEPAPAKTGTTAPTAMPPTSNKPIPSPSTPATGKSERSAPKRVHVSEEVASSLVLNKVSPTYPLLARQANVQGTVVLDANISKDGTVESLKVVSGHPLLLASAVETAKQLRYKPYLEDGEPVALSTRIIVRFTLSGR